MPQQQITTMLSRYAEAYSRLDAVAVSKFWQFPAIISSVSHTNIFADEEELYTNVDALFAFYAEQGASRAEIRLGGIAQSLPGCAQIAVQYDLKDAKGKTIIGWTRHYILRQSAAGWRMAIVLNDAENTAWSERGTKLGW